MMEWGFKVINTTHPPCQPHTNTNALLQTLTHSYKHTHTLTNTNALLQTLTHSTAPPWEWGMSSTGAAPWAAAAGCWTTCNGAPLARYRVVQRTSKTRWACCTGKMFSTRAALVRQESRWSAVVCRCALQRFGERAGQGRCLAHVQRLSDR